MGVVLLVAIAILLAALLSGWVFDVGDDVNTDVGPQAAFEAEYVPDGHDNHGVAYVLLTHTSGRTADGESVVIKDSDGHTVTWADIYTGGPEVESGEDIHIDGFGPSDGHLNCLTEGEVYYITWEDDDGTTRLIEKVEITDAPPASSVNECTDGWPPGIPDL